MHGISWSFLLLHVSTILVFIAFLLMSRTKNKQAIHYFSMAFMFPVFIWSLGLLLEIYAQDYFNYSGMLFTNIYFTAIGFVPVNLFLLGFAFAYPDKALKKRSLLVFLIPLVTTIMIWTNDYHHLFFVNYSLNSEEIIQGTYLIFETFLSYVFLLAGLYFLIYFSIKNSGFFSRQSFLIFIGALIPILFDMAFALKIFAFPLYFEAISFSFGALCFILAIFKFDFLSIVPVALQTVVDHISDSFIVVDENLEIADFNKTMTGTFKDNYSVKRKEPISEWLERLKPLTEDSGSVFLSSLQYATENNKSVFFDKEFNWEDNKKIFTIEITPVSPESKHRRTIILFKDITEQRNSFEMIRQAQERLIESEHLASLGQMVGGIAHNLKTPIMSISGGLEGLKELIVEYSESVGNPNVTPDDHHEIAKEMNIWIDKMKSYCSYMSDIISTVKGQAVQLTSSTTDKFILSELLKRIDILMNHELKRYSCHLHVQSDIDEGTEIKGEVNSLVQVINNLILNAIEAYEGKEGHIDLAISQKEDMIQFEIRDYAQGIPLEIQSKLFKEMITTKAKHGTGLGLYMSYSTIWGRFGGKMWFETKSGQGTSFFILIPCIQNNEGVEVAL